MTEPPNPPLPPSHASSLREDALRRLSRSPHPYHRQNFELAYASERFGLNVPPAGAFLVVDTDATEDDGQASQRRTPEGYRESTNSDSGTEADDEHFLKGLPAPRLRAPKGLRNLDGYLSSTSSPLLSPGIIDDATQSRPPSRRKTSPSHKALDEDVRKVLETFRLKRRAEIVRRTTEGGLLLIVGAILCLNPEVRKLVYVWKKELFCEILVIASLIVIYPLRLVHHIAPQRPWKRPLPLAIPPNFDPAPLLYPPVLTILASMLLFQRNPAGFLPGIVLSISSLPRELLPSTGGLHGSNTIHWALACIPILSVQMPQCPWTTPTRPPQLGVDPEILVLIPPLHQALCVTLHSLTTTSLLRAELQLMSVALIDLLLLASSPQVIILKSLLWGGGIGLLVTCSHVLRWGVALARVPKWRFRRPGGLFKPHSERGTKLARKCILFAGLRTSLFTRSAATSDSSEDEGAREPPAPPAPSSTSGHLRLETQNLGAGTNTAAGDHAVATGNPTLGGIPRQPTGATNSRLPVVRNTPPLIPHLSTRPSQRTPSGRRKRSASSSVQAFFNLTQSQATARKWLYAGYVYVMVLVIILVGIRDYVQRFALQGNEPIGWALGYFFGNIQRFRFEVVSANLQRWICLPPRSDQEHEESCHLGWVEHLRHASFGTANTRLILSGYWLGIIIVGIAVVYRLSSVYAVDTRRKVFHFMMVAMLLPATYVDPTFAALSLSLMLAIFLLLDLFRASQLPPLSRSLAFFLTPYVDGRDLKGPVVISHIFLLIGCAIPLWLSLGSLPRTGEGSLAGWEVPVREVSMVSGVICVGMGDAAASLIGRRYGRRKWLWRGGKSIEGSMAFATAVGLALGLAKAWLRVGGWPANNDDAWVVTSGKVGVAAVVASLTEAVLTGGNDNVVVPVVLWLCVKGLDI